MKPLILLPAAMILAVFVYGPKTDDSIAGLLHREDVQTELKLTTAQIKKWSELDRLPNAKRMSTFGNEPLVIPDPDEVEKKNTEREKKAWSILGPDQTVRLHQLFLQRNGVRSVLNEGVQFELDLRADQKDLVRRAKTKYAFSVHELLKEAAASKSELARLDPKKVNDYLVARELDLTNDLDRILTNQQRNRLIELGGKKFVFLERVFK